MLFEFSAQKRNSTNENNKIKSTQHIKRIIASNNNNNSVRVCSAEQEMNQNMQLHLPQSLNAYISDMTWFVLIAMTSISSIYASVKSDDDAAVESVDKKIRNLRLQCMIVLSHSLLEDIKLKILRLLSKRTVK